MSPSILVPFDSWLASIRRSLIIIITNKHVSEISTFSPRYPSFTQNMAQGQTHTNTWWLWLLPYFCCSCCFFQLETETDYWLWSESVSFCNLPHQHQSWCRVTSKEAEMVGGGGGSEWFGVAHRAPCGACLLIAMWHLHKASSGTATAAADHLNNERRQLTAGLVSFTCAQYGPTQRFFTRLKCREL